MGGELGGHSENDFLAALFDFEYYVDNFLICMGGNLRL